MSTSTALIVAVVLLLGNFYFVASEFALVSARRTRVEPRAAQGSRMARTTLRAMEDLSHVIAAAQIGITVCSLGLGAVAEPAVSHLLAPLANQVGLTDDWVHALAFVVALAIVMYLHVVFGEMVPKNLSLARPERAAILLGPPMMALITVIKPLTIGLDSAANGVVRALHIEPRTELASTFTAEQVEAMVDESRNVGLLGEGEYERLSGALGFSSHTVREVLLPLDQLQTVPQGARVTDVERICAETGFSRFPVTAEDGSLIGYLHVKDVLQPDPHGRARAIDNTWIRPFATVPVDATLGQALTVLQARGAHLALARDEHGRTLGVATLEDVIEELVGEIRDGSHADG